ncbi:MAG TPA: hypothetical protein VGS11_02345 [Candidatus Bathyarchaeia archaeon]|nr:hypothetical protein [Candidatus Bathyarchaeia archaeon]
MQVSSLRPRGVRTLVVLEGLTGLLILLVGALLIDLQLFGLTAPGGSGTFTAIGAVEIVLALLSFAAAGGLWMRGRWSRPLAMVLAAVSVLFNAALIGIAATLTGGTVYPAGATVLLILINDIILAEMPVAYLVTRPRIRAYIGRSAPVSP